MKKPGSVFILFIQRSTLFLAIMTLCRLAFYAFNSNAFPEVTLPDFLHGIRFDALAMVIGLAPYYLFHLLPLPFFSDRWLQRILSWYYLFVLLLFVVVNCIDVIYFRFTLKRSTWDIFHYVSTGDDTASLIPQFLSDYWYMSVLVIILMTLAILSYNRIRIKGELGNIKGQWPYFLVTALILFIAARGGVQLKPLHIIDASRYTSTNNVPLVLSTPFTLLKTLNSKPLAEENYFDQNESLKYFDPVVSLKGDSLPKKKNVVIIIMESMAKEYIGYYNDGEGYTPFLDSLMNQSTVFENAFANGRRSIEALPAIFSGLPNLMNEAFVTSPYAGNSIGSLAKELNKEGYYSAFFHGGKNGTMGFNSYTKSAGFDDYFGLDEYPDSEDFDGNWGVYDLPYFQYVAHVQEALPRPFLTGIFSLSAHHPYSLPANFVSPCETGQLPIHATICYADQALKAYFKKIEKAEWYKESVFIITADHTAQSIQPKYANSMGFYAIPIILFDPSLPKATKIAKTTQQADITLTILDYLGLETSLISFGQSALDTGQNGLAINYLQNVYQIIDNESVMLFDGQRVIGAGHFKSDPFLEKNLYKSDPEAFVDLENRLKALIQSYNSRMINNELTNHE